MSSDFDGRWDYGMPLPLSPTYTLIKAYFIFLYNSASAIVDSEVVNSAALLIQLDSVVNVNVNRGFI